MNRAQRESGQPDGSGGWALFLGARHAVDPRRIVNGAVDVVNSKGKGQLGVLPPQHGPIGLQVVEIVKKNSRNGKVLHVIEQRDFFNVCHLVVLIAEF